MKIILTLEVKPSAPQKPRKKKSPAQPKPTPSNPKTTVIVNQN